jgi:ribosomal protein S18 acetylase RimI-like enzyme
MIYRQAKPDEANIIAQLHATSWQTAYRGILSDDFLDNEVLNNRRAIWQKRFAEPQGNEYICVAIDQQNPKGFVCVYANDDEKWGALIDNLHVLPDSKGRGVGKRLMQEAGKWVAENYPQSGIYLWVYADNHDAILFYEKMGGQHVESALHDNPDGSISNTYRYVWTDIAVLLNDI